MWHLAKFLTLKQNFKNNISYHETNVIHACIDKMLLS